MDLKLKPCPFCGGEAYMDQFMTRDFMTRDEDSEWIIAYAVCCDNEWCHYRPYTERYSVSAEKAAEMWNRRVNP